MGSFGDRAASWSSRAVQCRTGWGRTEAARYAGPAMSTRKLILAALLCGMAILVAFTVQVLLFTGNS